MVDREGRADRHPRRRPHVHSTRPAHTHHDTRREVVTGVVDREGRADRHHNTRREVVTGVVDREGRADTHHNTRTIAELYPLFCYSQFVWASYFLRDSSASNKTLVLITKKKPLVSLGTEHLLKCIGLFSSDK